MTRRSTDTCAGCSRFDLDAAARNGGRAWCSGYGREVFWTDTSVLHVRASDRAHREQLVKQLAAQQPKEQS